MSNSIRTSLVLLAIACLNIRANANDIINNYKAKIEAEQSRIDLFDGTKDSFIALKSGIQSRQATEAYIISVNQIVTSIISNSNVTNDQKIDQLKRVNQILKKVSSKNYHFYTKYSSIFNLIKKVQEIRDINRLKSILKNNIYNSLNLIAFYIDKPVAEPFLLNAARFEPAELLTHFNEIEYKEFSQSILDEVAKVAPMKVKTYLHSWNPIHKKIKASNNEITKQVYKIFEERGSATRSYVLLNDIYQGTLTIEQAHSIARFDSSLFEHLIAMRRQKELLGEHSVDNALKYQCLKKVRVVNDLHEESDAIRFRSLNKLSGSEIYTLMVYSEDEIYTSTFLGMYKRMMAKLPAYSTYEFLKNNNFNKFRTLIKMCAGYNTLSGFLARMSAREKDLLFNKLVQNIENANDNLASAVEIADTYGSIKSPETRLKFERSIVAYYISIKDKDKEAEKLYSLILNVFDIGTTSTNSNELNFASGNLKVLAGDRIFKDGKNVQQHFFFDDPDGKASFAGFVATFKNHPKWTILDKSTYIIIKSNSGMKVEIFANKPSTEYAGQGAIKAYFLENQRWPDVVVHRGHSYFASAAIESLTPNAEIVFLGSCGGYNNISQVLKYSPDAQIISSKQIGTMLVNNKLCLELNEVIRKGQDIVWDDLWQRLDYKFANGSTANERFRDYIPPHKNLGALLIKTYRQML